MSRRSLNAVVRYLQQLTGSAGANGACDAELLERYIRHRDEAAFELLLWRHGTLVFNVCRRILPRQQDAEDAFQATFLAFVRKAGSISRRGSVASWLYKVAYRVALAAKEQTRKTAAMEKPGGEMLAIQSASDSRWSDVRPILDAELNRLPERLRRPIILCYLEGKSNEEAAQELGCRLGTIYSRLSRGRETLRQRLQRRGVTLSVTALTAALTASVVEASPAIPLMRSAVQAALTFADPSAASVVSPRVATLAEGVLRTMFVTKLKIAAVLLVVMGIAAGGVWTQARTDTSQPEVRADDAPPKPKAGDKKGAEPIAVKVVKPKRGSVWLMNASAKVIASQQQQIVPLVSGTVKEVLVDIGDQVKKGQTLLVLDAPLLAKEREQAASAFEMAQAEEQEAQARLAVAAAEVDAVKAGLQVKIGEIDVATAESSKWQSEVKRLEKEVERNVVAPQVLLESQNQSRLANAKVKAAKTAAATAEADVKVHQGKLEHAKAALKASHAATRSARTALEKTRIQESFTQLKAAFDGVVTRRTIDPGNFVQPSDSRLLRPLLTVQSIDRVRITALVEAAQARSIKRGLPVDLEIEGADSIPGQKIARFSPTLNDENHTMLIEIDFDNTGKHRLLPGMSGRVTAQTEAFTIPSSCLVLADDQPFVFIVRDGKAHRAKVDAILGEMDTDVIKGIQTSDLVITNPKPLKDGTPVKIENSP